MSVPSKSQRHFPRGRAAHWLDDHLRALDAEALSVQALANLRFLWLDGLFAAASGTLYSPFVALFAAAYGATNVQIGRIIAIANLMAFVALLPGASAINWFGRRKSIVVWSSAGVARVALLAWACLPFMTADPRVALSGMTFLFGLNAAMGSFGFPAWTSLVADMIPCSIRGRYLSSRTMVMGGAALLAAPLGGWLIRAVNGWRGLPFAGYQLTLLLAFLFGTVSTFFFQQLVEPELAGPRRRDSGSARGFRWLLHTPGLLGFFVSGLVFNLSVQSAGPFFSLFLTAELGVTTVGVGLLMALADLTSLLSQRPFGILVDRSGSLRVQLATGLLLPLLPTILALATSVWHVVFSQTVSGLLWAGYNLANFNLLLGLTRKEERASAAALFQMMVVGSAVIGPLIGGCLANKVGFRGLYAFIAGLRWFSMFLFFVLVVRPVRRLAMSV